MMLFTEKVTLMNEYALDGYKVTVKEEKGFDLHSNYSNNFDAVFV